MLLRRKRYDRQTVPENGRYWYSFCVTVDQQTKQDNTVTIRHRDTMQQERIPVDKVREIVLKEINT